MSCTNNCGGSTETQDASTDEQVQIAPEPARPATLTPEQPVKAPGQGGDILLTRGTPVEVEWPNGYRPLRYVDEGGYQLIAGWVGNVHPLPWGDGRIVRVLTEATPTQEPRRIKPEDVRVGMVVERRKGDAAMRDRVHLIDNALIGLTGFCLWMPEYAAVGWSLWLVEDAPEPVDPDAAAVEAIVTAYRRSPECSTHAVFGESMLDHLRAQGFDVTARAEQ